MAEIQPLRALHYDLAKVGSLNVVCSPPYDVIDPLQREQLAAQSPHNVVAVDLPEPAQPGGDPYAHAAELLARWQDEGAVVRDDEPALWVLTQEYTGPDGTRRTRSGFFARVRVTEYGPGRIRPHERTHPGPKEDRLRLTRATRTNLSPIFSLYDDPGNSAWRALAPTIETPPYGALEDEDGTVSRLWRVTDATAIGAVQRALDPAELLIADGHHRYETARVYADEIGGEGDHRYVLQYLVSLEDPGLTVFPTHRLVSGLREDPARQEALAATLRELFEIEELSSTDELAPPDGNGPIQLGYIDAHLRRPFRLTLKDQAIADARTGRLPRALPAPGHRGARGADPDRPARTDRGRHLALPRPRILAQR